MSDIDDTSRQTRKASGRSALKSYRLFSRFANRVWRHLNLPPLTPVQEDIANYLQFAPAKRMVMAFRGVGKSWLTAAYVVWRLLEDPQRKIMIVSASKDYADTMSTFIKRLIDELPECQHLKARPEQRSSVSMFDVGPALPDKSPSVKSVGITGQITGSRADEIIVDDVEVPKNSFTSTMRERLADLVKEFAYVIKPDTIDGVPVPEEMTPRITYLGTPQTEMSLYNKLPERGYDVRVWPARVPEEPSKYKGRLAPFIMEMILKGVPAGTPVDPKRFNEADLLGRQMDVGRSSFALQYQMDTSLSDGLKFPLRLKDFIVMGVDDERGPISVAHAETQDYRITDLDNVGFSGDGWYGPAFVDKAWEPWQGTVMAIDPSGKGEDETAYAVVRMLHGRLFLVASGGFKGGYELETLRGLAEVAKRYRTNELLIEENFGGGMFTALFRPVLAQVWPCTITEIRKTSRKEERIVGTLEPVLNSHRLVVDRSVVQADLQTENPIYSLFYQLTRCTREPGALAKDDRLDVLEMAVAYWKPQLQTDADLEAEQARADATERFFEDWLESMDNPREDRTPGMLHGKNLNWTRGPAHGKRPLAVHKA